MSFIVNYIYDYLNPQECVLHAKHDIYHINEDLDNDYSVIDKKYLISKEDLEKINLKPVDNIIPNPSRNMPLIDIVNLQSLNKAQLNSILNVKLKPIPYIEKQTKYKPRHPVLREILEKFNNC
jgi:hypothetical protein